MRDIFGIKKEEMMAVGDSPNDMAMLMDAGLAVAVANAEDEVKAVAGYIAPAITTTEWRMLWKDSFFKSAFIN